MIRHGRFVCSLHPSPDLKHSQSSRRLRTGLRRARPCCAVVGLTKRKRGFWKQALAPGANVSAVARAHDVSPQQVFAWRRKAIRSGEIVVLTRGSEAVTQSFASVEVSREDAGASGGLEIVIGMRRSGWEAMLLPTLLTEAIRAVRSA